MKAKVIIVSMDKSNDPRYDFDANPTVDQLIANSMKKQGKKMCAKCQQAAGAQTALDKTIADLSFDVTL